MFMLLLGPHQSRTLLIQPACRVFIYNICIHKICILTIPASFFRSRHCLRLCLEPPLGLSLIFLHFGFSCVCSIRFHLLPKCCQVLNAIALPLATQLCRLYMCVCECVSECEYVFLSCNFCTTQSGKCNLYQMIKPFFWELASFEFEVSLRGHSL